MASLAGLSKPSNRTTARRSPCRRRTPISFSSGTTPFPAQTPFCSSPASPPSRLYRPAVRMFRRESFREAAPETTTADTPMRSRKSKMKFRLRSTRAAQTSGPEICKRAAPLCSACPVARSCRLRKRNARSRLDNSRAAERAPASLSATNPLMFRAGLAGCAQS